MPGANLHLDTIHFAVPADDQYTPTVAVSIDPDTGAMTTGDEARNLHAGQNRGALLSIGYWCEDGCQGHVELRNHKGHLFAGLHNDPGHELNGAGRQAHPGTDPSQIGHHRSSR